MTMGEYEDRYPDSYGHGETTEPKEEHRHFSGIGLPRQVRDGEPVVIRPDPQRLAEQAPPALRPVERPRQPLVERTPREICDDVYEQLNASPFIDASGISITVDGSEVTLTGTINSLIAISLARALTTNVPGVSRVQVQLRVQQAPRGHQTVPDDA
jgi:hypothetical protein